ncbi:macrophage mannose receptor 1-like isoform X1 [Choristoneura fumiferana]|uniref:macrophage mannose receptor 1-like isoform X1 n=1 Tax=Choristoneura fumiferana TaxID=7141 RepID=UPI003D15AFD0
MIFFLSVCALTFYSAEGTLFRFDYTYHQEAEGWFKLHRIPATWQNAYLNCYYEGAVLASPETENLRAALKSTVTGQQSGQSLQSCGIFTGIHATFGKGAYFSVEGTPLSRIPVAWAPGEPDNANNSEDCLLMLPNGTLADVNCSDVYPYVCYRKKQKNMPALNACGTVDNGYSFDSRTNSCYKFHTTPLIWTRAFVACAHEGGYLAIINSKLEHQLIKELYSKSYSSIISGNYNRGAIHLGYKSFEHLSLWMTIHGQTLKEAGFEKWSKGQPDTIMGARITEPY